jgi:hypothetical protein
MLGVERERWASGALGVVGDTTALRRAAGSGLLQLHVVQVLVLVMKRIADREATIDGRGGL